MKFPTVGKRTAGRFVYYLLKLSKEQINEITNSINELSDKVQLCKQCFNPFEAEGDLCFICKDPRRNQKLLCIVEKEADLLSIENSKKYNGLYFILGGYLDQHTFDSPVDSRIENLKKSVRGNPPNEIILALNPTAEGKATSIFIETILKEINNNWKITHLARGLPVGGELEYADPETLESAIERRN